METETLSTYEQTNKNFLEDVSMDVTFQANESSNDTPNCNSLKDKEVQEDVLQQDKVISNSPLDDSNRDIEESRTDDEEDVPLNLDCSKSDEEHYDDDLEDSDHQDASDNEEERKESKDTQKDDLAGESVVPKIGESSVESSSKGNDEEEKKSEKLQDEENTDKEKNEDGESETTKENQGNQKVMEEASHQIEESNKASATSECINKVDSVNESSAYSEMSKGSKEDEKNSETREKGKKTSVIEEKKEDSEKGPSEGEPVEDTGDNEEVTKEADNHKKVNEEGSNKAADQSEANKEKGSEDESGTDRLKKVDEEGLKKTVDESEADKEKNLDDKSEADSLKKGDEEGLKKAEVGSEPSNKDSSGDESGAVCSRKKSDGECLDKSVADDSKQKESDGDSEASCSKKQADDAAQPSTSQDKGEEKEEDEFPLIRKTLLKGSEEDKHQEGDEDVEMDEDFDPSLLCPEVAMEVDEVPVIPNHPEQETGDGAKSPILFDSVFSMYVDEMTGTEVSFDLSPEEDNLRHETYGEKNPIQFTKIHCTACNIHLGSALDGQGNRFVHPLLKVLICKNCYHFYTSGEFEKDEDGSELYCRWCGQGGQVICCSTCEMVFCKKCIRLNFDRKKIKEIQDSDDWQCFRCNPSQITYLKIHCAEFMEYVRRESSRASTLENSLEFMNTDHTMCCQTLKKRATDSPSEQPPKRKRQKVIDEDYDPLQEVDSDESPIEKVPHTSIPSTSATAKAGPSGIRSSTFGSGTVKPTTPAPNGVPPEKRTVPYTYTPRPQFRPKVRTPTSVSQPAQQTRPQAGTPGYIKILPGGAVAPGSAPRGYRVVQPNRPTTPGGMPRPIQLGPGIRVRGPSSPLTSQSKHEWFEKTVRSAARVNSNLSYTLTQLNRQQASATSVEGLAVVHNKLQEILSTSINSLIQIRKNLRAEFIQGIKTAQFPNKPSTSQASSAAPTSSSAQDDDVIVIADEPAPPRPVCVPSPIIVKPINTTNNIINHLPNASSILKKNNAASSEASTSKAGPSRVSADKPSMSSTTPTPLTNITTGRPFLRVKSLTALQNVPSECITIPDDPVELNKGKRKEHPEVEVITVTEEKTNNKEEDKKKDDDDVQIISCDTVEIKEDDNKGRKDDDKGKKDEDVVVSKKKHKEKSNTIGNEDNSSNDGSSVIKKKIDPLELKMMKNVKVLINRLKIDKISNKSDHK